MSDIEVPMVTIAKDEFDRLRAENKRLYKRSCEDLFLIDALVRQIESLQKEVA
jgi:hypothetical protein